MCTRYDRPNQAWICGLAHEGIACPAGPTARGLCPSLAECVPVLEGDRWQCNRTSVRGGTCDEGPSPEGVCPRVNRCRPARSLRVMRGRFVRACTLLAIGGVMMMLHSTWRDRAISPGPLIRPHAQLLESNPADPNCAACHAAAERTAGGWALSLLAGHGDAANQSQRCMECHDTALSREFALTAHNLPPHALQMLTAAARSEPNSNGPSGLEHGAETAVWACATCHREHRGAAFDLAAMDHAACQTCHSQRYASFAADHPNFGAWPYVRRTRIAFDHASHQSKHFADRNQAFDCRSCHLDDATGQVQLLASYETACASCHDGTIATSVAQGVPMLAVPMIDAEVLAVAGHDVGNWPAAATGDFDGRLPPAMALMLAADPTAADALAVLGKDFDFFEIDPENPEQLEACAILVQAIKRLLDELGASGPQVARDRLQRTLGGKITDGQLHALFAGLSQDTIKGAVNAWFAPSDTSDGDWDSEPPPVVGGGAKPIRFDPAGAWRRDDATLSIRYRPAAHADPVLAGWLDLLATTSATGRQPLASAVFEQLSHPSSPGHCASCHSVERNAADGLAINWRAGDRTAEPRGLTRFSHGPHLVLPQLDDCTHCHTIDSQRRGATSYTGYDPHRFVSEFASLTKQQCATCHTSRAAGDRCQQCHNYHVDQIEAWRLQRREGFDRRSAN